MKKILQKMGVVLMIMTIFFNDSSTVVMATRWKPTMFLSNLINRNMFQR